MNNVRLHPWINTKTLTPLWGIQVRRGPRRWLHVVEDGNDGNPTPLLREREQDAEAEAASIRYRLAKH